jgi:hypothetical protein
VHVTPAPAHTSEPFNALTPAGLRHDPDAPGNHALALFHRTPGVRPSPPLYGTVRRGWCQLRGTVSPTFLRLTRRALEGGRRNPRRGDKYFFHVYTGLHREVRPAGTIFSIAISPVRPSPPLQRHSVHCSVIPDAVKVHGDRTSPRPLLCLVRPPSTAPSSQHAGGGRTSNL